MTRGINPYAKSELIKKLGKVKGTEIVENRIWHSDTKRSEYKKSLLMVILEDIRCTGKMGSG